MNPEYPDVDFCSDCLDHTAFEQDPETGEWLSVCCSARPYDVDYEPDPFDYDDLEQESDFDLDPFLPGEPLPEDYLPEEEE